MSYSTVNQVRIKLKDIIKREISDDIINSSISDADAMIDSYLCRYYDTTLFSSSIAIINTLSKTLAASFVTGTLFQDYDQSASTWESKQYNWAIKELKLLQDGVTRIPGLTRLAC